MAKTSKPDARPLGHPDSWSRTNGTYLAGRAYIDNADETAATIETKWGWGRLPRLVSPDLAERFHRQRYLFNQAIWHGDLEAVKRESGRMVNAWMALDRAAEAAGAIPLAHEVWEVPLANGSVAAIVRDREHMDLAVSDGRALVVYTIDEIAKLLDAYPQIAAVKESFPGAEIGEIRRRPQNDPLDAFRDSDLSLDDPLPDLAGTSMMAG